MLFGEMQSTRCKLQCGTRHNNNQPFNVIHCIVVFAMRCYLAKCNLERDTTLTSNNAMPSNAMLFGEMQSAHCRFCSLAACDRLWRWSTLSDAFNLQSSRTRRAKPRLEKLSWLQTRPDQTKKGRRKKPTQKIGGKTKPKKEGENQTKKGWGKNKWLEIPNQKKGWGQKLLNQTTMTKSSHAKICSTAATLNFEVSVICHQLKIFLGWRINWKVTMNVIVVVLNCQKCDQCLKQSLQRTQNFWVFNFLYKRCDVLKISSKHHIHTKN